MVIGPKCLVNYDDELWESTVETEGVSTYCDITIDEVLPIVTWVDFQKGIQSGNG